VRKGRAVNNNLVRNAFAILQAFRASEGLAHEPRIKSAGGLPKSSGHRLIVTLEELGAVIRGPPGRYRPGMLLVSLSNNVAIAELLREASQKVMARPNFEIASYRASGSAGGRHGHLCKQGIHAQCFPALYPHRSKLEAYAPVLAKSCSRHSPRDQLDNFHSGGGLVALTPYTITDRTLLRAELEKVRAQGYAME